MALSRQMLKAMGIEDEKIDQIIASHTETADGLKKLADGYKEQAEKVPALEKKVEELSAIPNDSDEWRAKYEEEHEAFEKFKAEAAEAREEAEKRELYRSLLREAGIDEKRVESVLKVADLSAVSVEGGELADRDALLGKVKDEWADFIVTTTTKGASVDDPPKGDPDAFEAMSLEEKMQYANENPSDASVKAWLGK